MATTISRFKAIRLFCVGLDEVRGLFCDSWHSRRAKKSDRGSRRNYQAPPDAKSQRSTDSSC
ncbi:unnamed protein product [Nezara viridula]|uniref:Uncharacterized protein n=1 Tax=Nezara viridula TaxID=85310 RepID=A0A9P0HRW4_NEZVI|nr:unnamed protein product [Nezara viridula]